MTAGIILLNFGEPETPTLDAVVPFLERIFYTNASLEGGATEEARRARSRELAERRAPGLIEEYEEIGGSPLNAQAHAQAEALRAELERRGHDVFTYVGMQFTDPLIEDAVERARADGVERLVGLAVYPLCGPSTNVAALAQLAAAVDAIGWDVELDEVSGWHTHPLYTDIRADAIRRAAGADGVDLSDPMTRLVFSAHGTPIKYLDEGSRYVEYVEEHCRALAEAVGVPDYAIGYQNHTNRRIEWTQPDVENVIERIEGDRVIVDAVSFMHEQSETLAELDHELREEAEARGLGFHRVPVPHDDPRFAELMAELCEPFLDGGGVRYGACVCRPGACCLNAPELRPA